MKVRTFLIAVLGLLFFCCKVDAATPDMVDISNHNGYMTVDNFVDMRNNYGVKSITTKISEGTYYHDYTAANNIQTAQAAGLYINGYHFARYQTVQQAKDEADYACRLAKADGLPIGAVLVSDVEAEQQQYLSRTTLDACNEAFGEVVKLYGYRFDVYTMGSWVNSKMSNAGWIASYPNNPAAKTWYSNKNSWQYSSLAQFKDSYGSFDVSVLYNNFYTGGQQVVNTINNTITVQTWNGNPTPMLNSNGESYLTTPLTHGTQWQGLGIVKNKDGTAMIGVGNNEYVRQDCTNLKDLLVINYAANYGVNAYNSKGQAIKDSNLRFKGGTRWKSDNKLTNIPHIGLCYQVSTDEFVPAKYQVGSGFQG